MTEGELAGGRAASGGSVRADVVVPVYADVALTRACLESVLAHSGPALARLIVVDDCGPDPAMRPMLRALRDAHPGTIVLRENARNLGFVGTANAGLAERTGDVVLLNSDTRVTPGWLEELLAVAALSDRTAAVVPLSNNATICSAPRFPYGGPPDEVEGRALALGALQPRTTELPTGVGFCMLMRAAALALLGGFDPAYGRGYNEENDWCLRAQQLGFKIVRANRAYVFHLGAVSFGVEREALERDNAARLVERFPHYPAQVARFVESADARLAAWAVRRRLEPPRVTLDVRHVLGERANGTGVYAFELARALATVPEVRVAVRATPGAQARLFIGAGVALEPARDEDSAQLVHRPAQVLETAELEALVAGPSPYVLTYQDLIGYRVCAAHAGWERFERYRALSAASLLAAQGVVAISEHNRRELVEEFGLDPARVHVVHHGVDAARFAHRDAARTAQVRARHGLAGGYFLYAGSDFPHKNLPLLLEAYGRYRAAAGPRPLPLVLVGPASHTRGGVYGRAPLPEGVRHLGVVPSDELPALLQEACAFVYPTGYEGFGLPVLEAMAAGSPVVCSPATAVPEAAGDAALVLPELSAPALASALTRVESDLALRGRLVEAGRARAAAFTWDACARATARAYLAILDAPPPDALLHKRTLAVLLRVVRSEGEAAGASALPTRGRAVRRLLRDVPGALALKRWLLDRRSGPS